MLGDNLLGKLELSSFESIKSRITCCLVNQKENTVFLRQAPHKQIEDLAEIYQISVVDDADKIGTMKINNALMSNWNISQDELHTLAIQNAERMYPPSFQSMTQVMEELLSRKEGETNLLKDSSNFQPDKMYVLSNKMKLNGATVLLYPHVLEQVQQIIGSDYYILPSSIHEALVVPKDAALSKKELGKMVREVNAAQVLPEERLSNCIYEYNADEKSLKQVNESLPKREEAER